MIIAELFALIGLKTDKGSFNQAEDLIKRVKQFLVGLVAFETVKWFKGLIDDTAELAGHLVELSQKTGVAINTLQQLEFAGKLSGAGAETLSTGLKFLARNAEAAATGGKTQAEAFRKAGVAVKDSAGNIKGADVLLMELADSFAAMPDGVKKSALAMDLFGRSGVELIPLLDEGRAGIAKLRQEFIELGGGLADKDAKALESWGDQVDKAKEAVKGLRNAMVVALLPNLSAATDGVIEWIKANQELLQQKIKEWAERVSNLIRDAWPTVIKIVKDLWMALKILAEIFRQVWNAAAPIVGIISDIAGAIAKFLGFSDDSTEKIDTLTKVFVGLGLAAAGAALATVIGWIAAAAPIIAFAAAVAGAYVALLKLVDLVDWFDKNVVASDLDQAKRAQQIMKDRKVSFEEANKIAAAEPRIKRTPLVGSMIDQAQQTQTLAKQRHISFEEADKIVRMGPGPTSAPGARVLAPQLKASITVNAAPAGSDEDTAKLIVDKMDDWWKGVLRTVPQ